MTRVLIAGNYYDEDVPYVAGPGTLQLIRAPFISELASAADFSGFVAALDSVDLLICRLVGADPAAFVAGLEQHGLVEKFLAAPCRKVFWSQDSHHMHHREAAAQPWFDRVYIAHRAYLDRFQPDKARYLPCAYTASSLPVLYQLNQLSRPVEWDVAFPHVMYAGAQRNPLTFEIAERLRKRGQRRLFAKLYGPEHGMPYGNLLYGLLGARVVLNVSLSDDLNIRNFEAVALNRVLLTNEVPDHRLQDLDYRKTHFFKRDLSDFDDALDAALADRSPSSVWRSVPGRNMLIDRYLSIINQELGTGFEITPPESMPPDAVPLPAAIDFSNASETIVYDDAYLLMHALVSRLRNREVVEFIKLMPAVATYPRVVPLLLSQLRRH